MQPLTSTASWSPHLADWARWLVWLAALGIVAWSPFAGGPRVPSAVLGLLGLWLLVRQTQTTLSSVPVRRWLLVFALLWVPALLSWPGSESTESSLRLVATLPLYALVGIGLIASVSDPVQWRRLRIALGCVLLAWILDSYVQFLFGVDFLGVPISADGRVVGLFGDNLRQAIILAALAPLLLSWLSERFGLPAAAVAYLALLGIVILSGVRGAWLITLLVGVLFAWLERHRVRWPWLVAGLVLVGLVGQQSGLVERKLEQTAGVTEWDFEQIDQAAGHRLIIWETALAMLARKPLTGVGANAFDEAYRHYGHRDTDPFLETSPAYSMPVYHAHHMWLSVAAESGLVGLAGLSAVAWLCLRWYRRAPPARRRGAMPCGVGLAVVAFPFNSQPILYTNWWLPVMMLLLCLFLAALGDSTKTVDACD